MMRRSDQEDTRTESVAPSSTQGPVYVAPGSIFSGMSDDRISLREIWQILWRRKGIIIAVTALFALGSLAYAITATEIFRAEVLLAPAAQRSAPVISGQLSGLAALAGVNTGQESNVEALAVLQSRDFAREFIVQNNLMPVLFRDDWDADNERWRVEDPSEAPDIRDGVRRFREQILEVEKDIRSGLVTLSVEWIDPDIAAEWAGVLVGRLNDRLRERALQDAQANVAYLQSEMARSNLVTMQQSIGQLLQSELQKLMLAKGNEEFAFKIVDPAVPPRYRERPKRALTAIVGTLLGGILGVFLALLIHAGRAGPDS